MKFDIEIFDFNEDENPKAETQEEIEKSNKKKDPASKKKDVKSEILSWLTTLFVAVLIAMVCRRYVLLNATVLTGSMEHTIMTDERLIGSRLSYLFGGPERGDIVFFYYPDNERERYVKRVIGLPGEHVSIREGKIYINDATEPIEEPYLKEEWINGTGPFEFHVPEDSYLMLGDNRNNSHDSRFWFKPYVAKDKIIGKAYFVYYPIDEIRMLK